jgi:hypothetical protein
METIDTCKFREVLVYATEELGYDWNTILKKLEDDGIGDFSFGINDCEVSLYEGVVYYADGCDLKDPDCIKVLKGFMEKRNVTEFTLMDM